jgi:DNA-binding PadR family transcriptional regulator
MFEHFREMHRERMEQHGEDRHGEHGRGEHGRGEHGRGECRHRHGRGGFDEDWEGFRRGFGSGGRERLFDNGHLRILILQLIADKPSYGYEIIKAIEEKLAGGYAPSPGVVYPTLTLLEEEGLATVASTDGSKKMYAATEEGKAYLKQNQVILKAIFGRIEHAGKVFGRGRSPQVQRAIMNLKFALKMRMSRGDLNAAQLSKIAEIIDGAARAIDEA